MNNFSKSSLSELSSAKEELDMLHQKIEKDETVALTLENQLKEANERNNELKSTAQMWENKVKEMDEAHRIEISDLREELSIYKQIKEISGERITVAVSESIKSSLQGIRQEYELKVKKFMEDIQSLQNRLIESENLRDEGLKEVAKLKVAHLNSEKQFAEGISKGRRQYEVDRKEIEERYLSKLEELKKGAGNQGEWALLVENHSEKQSDLITTLQEEIRQLNETNTLLRQDIQEKERILIEVQQKQVEWKEKVKKVKRQDNETIENLKKLLGSASASATATEVQLDPQPDKELEKMREKFKEEQMNDRETIKHLREQLEATVTERDRALERASQGHAEVECLREQLNKSNDSLKNFESNLLLWKEKVKAVKLRDTEKISALEAALSESKDATTTAIDAMKNLLTRYSGPIGGATSLQEVALGFDKLLSSVAESLALFSSKSMNEQTTPLLSMTEHLLHKIEYLSKQQSCLQQVNENLERDKNELQNELRKHEEELQALEQKYAEVSNMVHRDELDKFVELNRQLEERCELLRKELKRQREAFHRDRAHQELTSGLASIQKDPREIESALRAAAGGVFEKDMLSLAATQSQRDNELRIMRMKLTELEKENTDLKKSCEHNNKVVVEYTKEIEAMKSNQRVQISIEYVRNIIYQFLCANEDLRMKLIPAIGTVLEFNTKEKQDIRVANPKCPKFH